MICYDDGYDNGECSSAENTRSLAAADGTMVANRTGALDLDLDLGS
ncbi:hypothetical protein ABES02_29780 [Neobacillus pocheonensis]